MGTPRPPSARSPGRPEAAEHGLEALAVADRPALAEGGGDVELVSEVDVEIGGELVFDHMYQYNLAQ